MFDPYFRFRGTHGSSFILSGFLLLFIGLVILVFPEILIAFIASIFIVGGLFSLYFGWKMRKEKDTYQRIEIN
jgi:hypothetical protein